MAILDKLLRKFSRRFIYERKMPRRRCVAVPTRFRVRSGKRVSSYVEAQTRDVSQSGLAVETRTVRVDGLHIYDSVDMVTPTVLDLELELPGGQVSIAGETVRYDATDEGAYLLGVRIVDISDVDRRRYTEFLRTLDRR